MNNINNLLVGKRPEEVLIFGGDKMFTDEFLWFEEDTGIATSYQVQEKDVNGHFGIMRGVDMIEVFGQSGTAACTALVCKKEQATRDELLKRFRFVFLGIDQARFHNYAKTGEQLICISQITSFRFRQMTLDGQLYRVPKDFKAIDFFKNYSKEAFQKGELPDAFEKIAEFKNLVGRAIKLSKLN